MIQIVFLSNMGNPEIKEDQKGIKVQGKHIIKAFRTVTIRYINSKGKTVGFEDVLIPKRAQNLTFFFKPFLKKWNSQHFDDFKATRAEEYTNPLHKEEKKPVQLTLF